jgi:Bacterial regulatory proteins, lacI family.
MVGLPAGAVRTGETRLMPNIYDVAKRARVSVATVFGGAQTTAHSSAPA